MSDQPKRCFRNSVPETFDELVAPEKTALVMWDMQKGLAGRAPNAPRLVERARALVAAADEAGVFVVWSQHSFPSLGTLPGPWLLWMMRRQKVQRVEDLEPVFQRGTEAVEFIDELRPSLKHRIAEKSQPSIFFDTAVDSWLRVRGIRSIVLCGFATDIGVEFSARHATALGYFPVVAEDACDAYTVADHERGIAFLRTWGHVVSTGEITAAWGRRSAR